MSEAVQREQDDKPDEQLVPAPPDPKFEALLQYLKESRGFDFTGYKRSSLMRRVNRQMQLAGITGYDDYRDHLETLNTWRNAIAHNDFAPNRFPTTILLISEVREWRRSCNHLARLFDALLQHELTRLAGVAPW